MLQNPQQIQPNNIPNRQDDNQNVILDARGRVVENVDNDDELGQHDWLDYIYTFSRFMVLISIGKKIIKIQFSNQHFFSRCLLIYDIYKL
jgi:hypothetical protein